MGFRDDLALDDQDENLLDEIEDSLATQRRLDEIGAELELYRHPLWEHFARRLASEEIKSLESMVNGPPEEMPLARERVKLARHLARIPENLAAEQARLLDQLKPDEEDEEE